LRARFAALRHRAPLPPGEMNADDSAIDSSQGHLLGLSQAYGPVFKVWWHGKITTCVIGLATCHEFLRENAGKVRADTVDFSDVFPHGFLRAMEGDTHQKYKQAFVSAMRGVAIDEHKGDLKRLFWTHLAPLHDDESGIRESQIAKIAKACATSAMIRLIYGADGDSQLGSSLAAAHDFYVPNGTPVVIRDREKQAFAAIKSLLAPHVQTLERGAPGPSCLLKSFIESGKLDETALGNLIQMVEFGRYDTHGLWRWIVHFLARNPGVLRSIRQERSPEMRSRLAQMTVYETLRLEQSEAVVRIVTKPFVFSGFTFAANTRVRLCIWESHKDERNFAKAYEFRPERFLNGAPPPDQYAPLGLGHHKCLGANWTFAVGAIFVECLAERFDLQAIADAQMVMGHFHFEPGPAETASFRLWSVNS
jgi:cytochrome P450